MYTKKFKYVYKVYCPTDENEEIIYIGSTITPLCHRLSNHKYKYRLFLKDPSYTHTSSVNRLFEKYGMENCRIKEILKYDINDETNIREKEQECINNYRAKCVNKQIAYKINNINI